MTLMALSLLVGLSLASRMPCALPNCGAFYAFVSMASEAHPTNCTFNKVLTNGAVEYSGPTPVCTDVGVAGAPSKGVPVSCMDGGYRTGNASFVYFTSGSGQYIHRFLASKEDDPKLTVAATLPKSYDLIVGMQHVPWGPSGQLYVITRTTLYQVPSTTATAPQVTPVLDIKNLSLSSNALVSANRSTGVIYVLDPSLKQLHTISLPSGPVASVPLRSTNVNITDLAFIQAMGRPDDLIGLIGMTANSPVQIVQIDPSTGLVTDFYDLPKNATRTAHASSVEMDVVLHFNDKDTVYTVYMDEDPVDFGLPAPLAGFLVRGDMQFFE